MPLPFIGQYSYRKDGEQHAWNPETIATLQLATRHNSWKKFKEYTSLVDNKPAPIFIRDFLEFRPAVAVPLEEVESEESIMRRFVTGAMSFGSISREAHEALALAMNKIGARSNTGGNGKAKDYRLIDVENCAWNGKLRNGFIIIPLGKQ